MTDFETDYKKLMFEGSAYIKNDESIKLYSTASSLVKKSVEEFCEENELSLELKKDEVDKHAVLIVDGGKISIHFEKGSDVDNGNFSVRKEEMTYNFTLKQWRGVQFILFWGFQKENKTTIEWLEQVVEKMKVDFSANKKIEELNSNTVDTYLTAISNKHNIKYKIEKDNTFCSVVFYLRPYCKLKMKLCYAELANQLESIDTVIQQSLLIRAKSNLPQVSLTFADMSSTGLFR